MYENIYIFQWNSYQCMSLVLTVMVCTVYWTKRHCNQAEGSYKSYKMQRNSDYSWNSQEPIVQSNPWSSDSHNKLFTVTLVPYSECKLIKRPQYYTKPLFEIVKMFGTISLWIHLSQNRQIHHCRRPCCCMKWHHLSSLFVTQIPFVCALNSLLKLFHPKQITNLYPF